MSQQDSSDIDAQLRQAGYVGGPPPPEQPTQQQEQPGAVPPQYPSPGQYQPPQQQAAMSQFVSPGGPPQPQRSGLALASMITGISGMIIWLFVGPFAGIASAAAIVLAIMAQRQLKAHPHMEGKGFAITGLVTGIVGVAITLILIVMMIIAVVALGEMATTEFDVSYDTMMILR